MNPSAKRAVAAVFASLRHRNATAMIEWLRDACGSEKRAMHADGGVVHHAQPAFGNGGSGYRCRGPEGHPWSFGDCGPREHAS